MLHSKSCFLPSRAGGWHKNKIKCQTVKVHIEILLYVLAWSSSWDVEVSYQNLHSTSVYLDSAWIVCNVGFCCC